MGTIAMKNEEIRRLSVIFSEAFELFDATTDSEFIESLEFTPDDITWEVEEELLNRLVGSFIEEDEDTNQQTHEGIEYEEEGVDYGPQDIESDFSLPVDAFN